MKNRFLSLLVCFCMVFAMLPTVAFASDTVTITVTSDAADGKASAGQTVNYTVTMGAVSELSSASFELDIPEGMEYVAESAAIPTGLNTTLGMASTDWTEGTLLWSCYGNVLGFASASDTVLLTFSCKVKSTATGSQSVTLKEVDLFKTDNETEIVETVVPAAVTVGGESPLTAIAIPTANTGLVYDGTEKTGVNSGTGYTLSGDVTKTNAGNYTAVAKLDSGYKWNDDTIDDKNIPWSIAKADPSYIEPTDLEGTKGNALSTVTLPTGWTWSNAATVMSETGNKSFPATFTPDDIANYNVVNNISVTVNVKEAPVTPAINSVTVSPATAEVVKGKTQKFTAKVDKTGEIAETVTWSVNSTKSTISAGGILTVGSDETAKTLTVTATSTADPTKSGTATVTVKVPVFAVSVTNGTVTDGAGNTLHAVQKGEEIILTANAPETGKRFKEWTGLDGVEFVDGTSKTNSPAKIKMPAREVTATAVYEDVPASTYKVTVINGTGSGNYAEDATVTIKATVPENKEFENWSSTDSGVIFTNVEAEETTFKMVNRPVTVTANLKDKEVVPTINSVTVSPATAEVVKGNTQAFTAKVNKTGEIAETVTWTVTGANSTNTSISDAGLFTVGADETATTLTVKATSTADESKYGTATVTVKDAPVTPAINSVTVSPATAEVVKGNTQAFTAKVNKTGEIAETVTWTVTGANSTNTSISDAGLLTVGADETATTLTVKATSTADESKYGTATVTVKEAPVTPAEHTVTVTNGTATPSSAVQGTKIKIKADSKDGYTFDKWVVVEGDVELDDRYSKTAYFTMPDEDVEIKAKYEKDSKEDSGSSYSLEQITSDSKYAVNVDVSGDGTAKSDKKTAGKGATVTITVTPDEGSVFERIVVTDKYGDVIDVKDQGDGEYTFRMPGCKVYVNAYFTTVVEEPAEKTMILTIGDRVAIVNGEYVENDVAPIIRNERTMLPARFVAEELGATVAWDEELQKVTITKGETVIEIYINQPYAFVNNESIELDSPAFIENGRTYLPLRFITENLGAEVEWDAVTQKVTIKY